MKVFCSAIAGTGSFYFIFKRADVKSAAICSDSDVPGFFLLSPGKTLIFGTGGGLEFSSVPDILGVSCETKISLSIVKSVMVQVVAEAARRDVYYEMVHILIFPFLIFPIGERADGIISVGAFVSVPFIFYETVIVFRINYCKFFFC